MSIQTASAYAGTANVPRIAINSTMDLNGMYVSPAGGRVFHVRGNGTSILAYDDQYGQNTADMNQRLWPSVASVLPYCVANRGDLIIVHKNHTENIGAADAWAFVAGLTIVGQGWGQTRPTFTFTVAAAQLLIDVAGVTFQNCRFLCAGPAGTTALTVTAPFSITGEGALFVDNFFEVGIDADQLCTTPITVKAADCAFFNNRIIAQAAAAPTANCIVLGSASTGADRFTFVGNYVKCATSGVAVGVIANIGSSATSVDIVIQDNYLHNWTASSTTAISFAGNMVTTGLINENTLRVELNSSVQGIVFSGTGVDCTHDNNRICNAANETAKQNQGTVSA
jgi:hypothetical protein